MTQTDMGGEFINSSWKTYLKKKRILFRPKIGSNKASVAENAIKMVKLRLYNFMRAHNEIDWTRWISNAVAQINATPSASLGNLSPDQLNSPIKAVLLDLKVGLPEFNTWRQQLANQTEYEQSKGALKVGDFVMPEYVRKPHDRGWHATRCVLRFHIIVKFKLEVASKWLHASTHHATNVGRFSTPFSTQRRSWRTHASQCTHTSRIHKLLHMPRRTRFAR